MTDRSGPTRQGPPEKAVVIGILALQGAFAEHHTILSRLIHPSVTDERLSTLLVRTATDLEQCDALIIPGGESTTIASVASRSGMLQLLRDFCRDSKKPVWGTCAGCILMAEEASAAKRGGQELFGGVGISVLRNGFGSQLESFEASLDIPSIREPEVPFSGVFIRAPIIKSVVSSSAANRDVEILARLPPSFLPSSVSVHSSESLATDSGSLDIDATVVALRQGRKMITTFHPELTKDDRLHEYFVRVCVLGSPSPAK